MSEQRELPLTFPELSAEAPLIPVRMINEYVYCPRLAYLELGAGGIRAQRRHHRRQDQAQAGGRTQRRAAGATGRGRACPRALGGAGFDAPRDHREA